MKKANLILTCIGLLSVIGGALAFKAQHRFTGKLFCYTNKASLTPVPTNIAKYTTTSVGTQLFCTIPGPNPYVQQLVRQLD